MANRRKNAIALTGPPAAARGGPRVAAAGPAPPFPVAGRAAAAILIAAAAAVLVGCGPAARRPVRLIDENVTGALGPAALRDAYHTPAFVVRRAEAGRPADEPGPSRHAAVQDTDLAPDSVIDDANLIIFVEGSADTVDGFRWTARLLAESPHGFRGGTDRLVVVLLKWSTGISPVAEHLNRGAQEAGAALLADMLEVHRRRHGPDGHVSIVGFSAGTRVIERAFADAADGAEAHRPPAFARVDNVVFLGSSIGSDETLALADLRGRFINFVSPRDTHFGDRAAYVAPAGSAANPLRLLHQATIARRPRFGASVAGFTALPVLTSARQFDALEALEQSGAPAQVRSAFKMVNVPVPRVLVPYSLFGTPLLDDDLDDYVNLAPNHYILVGRGPGGRTEAPSFRQYSASAEEFVREIVAEAAMRGRVSRFDLKTVPRGANPIGLPLPIPWAVLTLPQQAPVEAQPAEPETSPPQTGGPQSPGPQTGAAQSPPPQPDNPAARNPPPESAP